MILRSYLRRTKRRLLRAVFGDEDSFLTQCRGVVHVGANTGQERSLYAEFNLPVLWIEPLPEVFAVLERNLLAYPQQRAIRALVTDRDNETKILHVSNNDGESSSILDFKLHKDIWPEITYVRDIVLPTITLDTLLDGDTSHDALIIDTQGSELLVLKGAEMSLPHFKCIKTEAADFESYTDCATVDTISDFLFRRGYELIRQDAFAQRSEGGTYYDLLFRRS
jgi:FkbM family methyltransferase